MKLVLIFSSDCGSDGKQTQNVCSFNIHLSGPATSLATERRGTAFTLKYCDAVVTIGVSVCARASSSKGVLKFFVSLVCMHYVGVCKPCGWYLGGLNDYFAVRGWKNKAV